ncbi:hypothetical protein PBRA_006562 [Plasmodiophora brassicae]|uniref:Uncharacterized protein n=1 Tax=Plasmodiophora brassicae TaxID=37360 RepID=A0A0G4ISW7_PLABS|nr:hypothetical protein PBRA_006562 [Plasmodiophora brassicae]
MAQFSSIIVPCQRAVLTNMTSPASGPWMTMLLQSVIFFQPQQYQRISGRSASDPQSSDPAPPSPFPEDIDDAVTGSFSQPDRTCVQSLCAVCSSSHLQNADEHLRQAIDNAVDMTNEAGFSDIDLDADSAWDD